MATVIRTISPSTNQVICERNGTTVDEARAIVARSDAAFRTFSKSTLAERRAVVARALCLVQQRKTDLGRELSEQMGRPVAYSHKEIETMQKRADYLMDIAEDALAPLPGRPEAGFRRYVKKVPVGPTLIVFAWNFPYLILVNALVPALLAGNSVILKPSPQTPLVGERLVDIFSEAGLPEGVLTLVQTGDAAVVNEVAQSPQVGLVSFTGSTAGGLALRQATAGRTVPLNLELGGNDPAYVRADVDVAHVAAQLVDGAVFNSGQSCCSVERIYVHADVHDEFVEELRKEVATYVVGDPMDEATMVGPVVSRAAQRAIAAQIEDALSKGATNATPGTASDEESLAAPSADGNYVAPCILTGVTHDMAVMADETFGPVMPVMKVSGDDEAVRLMNDSEYGLTASVWTNDVGRGEELADEIEAGTVFVNRCDYPSPDLAWTGWKRSGLGCTLGPRAFDAFVKLKSYHVKENQA